MDQEKEEKGDILRKRRKSRIRAKKGGTLECLQGISRSWELHFFFPFSKSDIMCPGSVSHDFCLILQQAFCPIPHTLVGHAFSASRFLTLLSAAHLCEKTSVWHQQNVHLTTGQVSASPRSIFRDSLTFPGYPDKSIVIITAEIPGVFADGSCTKTETKPSNLGTMQNQLTERQETYKNVQQPFIFCYK